MKGKSMVIVKKWATGRIVTDLTESIEVKKRILKDEALLSRIEDAAAAMIDALRVGNKIIFCGNGGSAADAQHLTAELVGRFMKERDALPAITLTANTSILTAIGNDYGYHQVFSRQLKALATKGDVLVGISTSGNSENVIQAVKEAKRIGLVTIGLLGCDGGKMGVKTRTLNFVDIPIIVPSNQTCRIQEAHIAIGHILCGLVEKYLFPE